MALPAVSVTGKMMLQESHLSQGAIPQADGSVLWRLWAPRTDEVRLVVCSRAEPVEAAMHADRGGYFTYQMRGVEEGLLYAYKLEGGPQYPDPASRWQPQGVHRPSAVFFPGNFPWSDAKWQGIERDILAIYELHIGAFTPGGTFDAAIERLGELADLGVTAIEIMPVAQFPGTRNWGYDGVHPFAAQNTYGGPRGLQRLVDAAHNHGLAVILDVVYNHLGPEGNYLDKFGPYFTDRYHTPWGKAINFDGPDSDPVRKFYIDNACAWVRDFHVDGLRLDAVQTIFDLSAWHILAETKQAVEAEARRAGRIVHVIAETDQNDVRLINPPERGGYGLDGIWSDDFHHSVHALLTGQRDGYYQDFGRPQDLAKSYNSVFVYDGCYSPFRRCRRGNRVGDADRRSFVVCIQNHDQVGNRARGERLAELVPPGAARLACALLMLNPCTPLVFMGEEYGEARPFPFFCSFGDPRVIEAVRRGRREEFAALSFEWSGEIPDPHAEETFASARLSWAWPAGSHQAKLRTLYADLLKARREWPPLADGQDTEATLIAQHGKAEADPSLLVIRRGRAHCLTACANLSPQAQVLPGGIQSTGRVFFSTEDTRYGGSRERLDSISSLLPYELVCLAKNEWEQ